MTEHDGSWIAAMKVGDKGKQGAALCCGARVGGMSGGIKTALIADANGVGVVVAAVGTGNSLCPTPVNGTVRLHIIVIADVFPAIVAYMVAAALAEGVPAVAARCAAVDDDKCYSSHYVCFYYQADVLKLTVKQISKIKHIPVGGINFGHLLITVAVVAVYAEERTGKGERLAVGGEHGGVNDTRGRNDKCGNDKQYAENNQKGGDEKPHEQFIIYN